MILLCVALLSLAIDRSHGDLPPRQSEDLVQLEPTAESVFERNLVTEKVFWKNIVKHHKSYSTLLRQHRNFTNDVLAYVTPWNNHGYDVAKTFGSKFTQVSPVWLQLKYDSSSAFVISGTHDIDRGWVREVRDTGAKLLPRLLFENWTPQQIIDLADSRGKIKSLAKVLSKLATENNFDGFVFELWSQYNLGGKLADQLITIIQDIFPFFEEASLDLILVIPPPIYDEETLGMFSKDHFNELRDHVTAFSLMTYDYSNPQRPGPNSPIQWVKRCVEHLSPQKDEYRRKILVGFNFYGFHYTATGGGPILGNQYIDLIKSLKPKLTWREEIAEHYSQVSGDSGHHILFFPTLNSISKRIDLCREMDTGISLWEIGQGLDYFYDLF